MPEPDGPQFQNLWAAAMGDAQANLDALSDQEIEAAVDDSEEYDLVDRCGYCGEGIDYCQGHGEDERAEFGFEPDSEEYDERRNFFETNDMSGRSEALENRLGGTPWAARLDVPGSLAFLRHGDTTGGSTPEGARWEAPTHSGLAADRFIYDDENPVGPDYSQPDPFDSSDPEQARQAQNIADMEETVREDIERSSRPRNEGN